MSLRRALLTVAVLGALAPAAAAAQDPAVGSPVFGAALATGVAHWGGMPCGGDVEVRWAPLPEGTLGYAEWLRPAGSTDPAEFVQCRIDLAAGLELGPALLCTVLAHELGHLHGRGHADDAADLMAAQVGAPLPACVAGMRAFAAEPAARQRGGAKRAKKRARHRHKARPR